MVLAHVVMVGLYYRKHHVELLCRNNNNNNNNNKHICKAPEGRITSEELAAVVCVCYL